MRKNDKGVITVFLALVFGLILTFLVNLINMTMVNSAKNQILIASDAAITSTLAGYNRGLYEDYGLFAFEEDDEMLKELVDLLQENLSGNEGLNSMFNYEINSEDVSAVTGGNIFQDNDIMKKQMIYSMKYQGTENLVLGAFEKIKEFLNSKEIIKETEKLEEVDKKVMDIEDEIGAMQNSKLKALEALIELAKNNNYEILGKGNIGYIDSIPNIIDYYPGNRSIEEAFNSIKDYNSKVYLPKVYSYYYTKLALNMYKQYLSILKEESVQGGEAGEKIDVTNIDKLINDLDKLINDEIGTLDNKLASYIKNISKGKEAVNELIDGYDTKVKPILDSYKESMENSKNVDIKKNATESYNEYNNLLGLDNLKKVDAELTDILSKLNSTKLSLDKINVNYSNLSTNNWVTNNKNNGIFNEMNNIIGKEFSYPPNIDNFVKGVCENSALNNNSELANISNIQIKTIEKNLSSYNSIKMQKPTDDGRYKAFYEMFKSFSDIDIKDDIKINGESKESFKPVISKDNNNETKKLSEQLEEIEKGYDLSSLESLESFIATGGEPLDKLYLIEYVMTNFKDRSSEFSNPNYNRIPEITDNSTTLKYEIESIISGNFDDSKSDTTLLDDFIAMRMTLNTISLMTKQKEIKTFINAISPIISASTGGFIPEPLVKSILILGWASIETRYDIIDIFNGYSVPVIKKDINEWVSNFGLDIESFDGNLDIIDSISKDYKQSKKEENSYNKQGGSFALNYTDMVRLKLLITKSDKIINGSQNIIVENKKLQESYKNYKSNIEVEVNKSKLNILFNTDVFSSKDGHSFNKVTFKKGYN